MHNFVTTCRVRVILDTYIIICRVLRLDYYNLLYFAATFCPFICWIFNWSRLFSIFRAPHRSIVCLLCGRRSLLQYLFIKKCNLSILRYNISITSFAYLIFLEICLRYTLWKVTFYSLDILDFVWHKRLPCLISFRTCLHFALNYKIFHCNLMQFTSRTF